MMRRRAAFLRPAASLRRATRAAVLALAFLLCASPALADPDPAPAQPPQRTPYEEGLTWFSRDKAFHFTISAAGSAVSYAVARELGLGRLGAAITAAVVTGTAGVLREIVALDEPTNRLTRTRFSRRDMVWNSVGIVVGISISDLIAFAGR